MRAGGYLQRAAILLVSAGVATHAIRVRTLARSGVLTPASLDQRDALV